jgi:hypothetical protein
MSGYVEYAKAQTQLRNLHQVAFSDRVGYCRDRLAAGTVDWDGTVSEQIGDAADVVGVVVGGEYGAQFQPLVLQVIEHGLRVARIDDCGVTVVPKGPDVIVLERAQRNDVEIIFIGHKPSFRGSTAKVNPV